MDDLSPDLRFNLTVASGLAGAIIGILIAIFLHQNIMGFFGIGLIGLLIGLQIGNLFFHEPEREELPKRIIIPKEMKDSYYDNLLMKKIMEIYQPQQALDDEEDNDDDDETEEDEREEQDELIEEGPVGLYDSNDERLTLTFWQAITYPTQIPLTIGILWPFLFLGMGLLFSPDTFRTTDDLLKVLPFVVYPLFFLVMLSGLLVLTQKTTATLFGEVIESPGSFIDGITKIVIGLAGCIYFLFLR